jgi:hypothetical protein
MATIEWRGRRCPLVLCKRVGSRLTFKCRHCSKAKGQPVYHNPGISPILPRHDFAMCEVPSSPYRRTGYVLAIEPPRSREELTLRIGRVLLRDTRMPLDQIHHLTKTVVEALGDLRWPQTDTVATILQGERGFEQLEACLWNNSSLQGLGL